MKKIPDEDKHVAQCPLCLKDGISMPFGFGTQGWDKHIAAPLKHPNWHPGITDPVRRKALFCQEFPEWFEKYGVPRRVQAIQRILRKREKRKSQGRTIVPGVLVQKTAQPTAAKAPRAAPRAITAVSSVCPTCGQGIKPEVLEKQLEELADRAAEIRALLQKVGSTVHNGGQSTAMEAMVADLNVGKDA